MKYLSLFLLPLALLFGCKCPPQQLAPPNPPVAAPSHFTNATTIISVPTPGVIQVSTAPANPPENPPCHAVHLYLATSMPSDPAFILEKSDQPAGPFAPVQGMNYIIPEGPPSNTYFRVRNSVGPFSTTQSTNKPDGFFSGIYVVPINHTWATLTVLDQYFIQ